ncbi:dinitrogenase iron-molybdenum cofactor N-terminal domain-containing protein [Oceanobacter mangrovi]|uniref:dinitrogenase iron-molybdenum cofactor N-terminal domain-containing protein n=1 Tax=Oceanobacter mangrovi TaxID=2862510 RepID=UPI001C8D30BF|nr:dinitrogenase iron-molybdenum cofactor N-terminal domain-containing protein [Oceanobacter mangrovi]
MNRVRPLTDDMALRIGMAHRCLPGVELDEWVAVVIRAVGVPLSPERVKRLRLKRLRQAGRLVLRNLTDDQLRNAMSSLRGHGVDLRATLPAVEPYQDGDMPGSLRAACASNRGDRIDAPFGNCDRFLIYQVSVQEIRLIEIREVSEHLRGHSPRERYDARTDMLADCQLVCSLTLGATAGASVVRAGLHPIRTVAPRPAPELLAELQEVMADNPPPWMDNLMRGQTRERIKQESWV